VKRLILLTLFLQAFATYRASAADRHIAFERKDAVFMANMDASVVRKLNDGVFPAISPDGKMVAFATVDRTGGKYIRRIAVIDIGTGATRVFDKVPSDNSYNPVWSPDGNWLAFTTRADGVWNLAIVKPDGTDFKVIKKGEQQNAALFSPCWAGDGKSLFCQGLTQIYRIWLDGSVIEKWEIGTIVPNGSMSGDGRIDLAPDGHRLLLSVDMNEEYNRKDWDGPVPALWSFDLSSGVAVRLTSNELFAWDGCWLDDSNLMFVSQRAGEKKAAIYRTNGKTLKRMIEDARHPSVNRPQQNPR
jgi:TolB protein